MPRSLKFVLALSITIGAAAFIATMLMVIYPGSLKVTAPILCPDDRPDPIVVRYDVQTSDGTGTNFTLFCLSDRGEFVEVGTWEPLGLLFLFVGVGMVGAVLLWMAVGLIRGSSSAGSGAGPPEGPDPFEQMLASQPAPFPDEN
jgi:hypothetical protein